jgi:hypothetical protein
MFDPPAIWRQAIIARLWPDLPPSSYSALLGNSTITVNSDDNHLKKMINGSVNQ